MLCKIRELGYYEHIVVKLIYICIKYLCIESCLYPINLIYCVDVYMRSFFLNHHKLVLWSSYSNISRPGEPFQGGIGDSMRNNTTSSLG